MNELTTCPHGNTVGQDLDSYKSCAKCIEESTRKDTITPDALPYKPPKGKK